MTEILSTVAAVVGYITLAGLAVVALLALPRGWDRLARWYSQTTAGRAGLGPYSGVVPLRRLVRVLRTQGEHDNYEYQPYFAGIGLVKVSVGVLYIKRTERAEPPATRFAPSK